MVEVPGSVPLLIPRGLSLRSKGHLIVACVKSVIVYVIFVVVCSVSPQGRRITYGELKDWMGDVCISVVMRRGRHK